MHEASWEFMEPLQQNTESRRDAVERCERLHPAPSVEGHGRGESRALPVSSPASDSQL